MIAVKAMMDVTKRSSKLKAQISDFSKRLHRDQKGDTPIGSSNNKYTQIPKSLSFFSDVQAYNATEAAAISLPDILKICCYLTQCYRAQVGFCGVVVYQSKKANPRRSKSHLCLKDPSLNFKIRTQGPKLT
ncbi:hypothetical protein D5086_030336 [Populus alba]|uniref:Uncharacterized protein n=1 Tax=Populus alba TaxID=43335 RepID=A0ACC4AN91_POPAL